MRDFKGFDISAELFDIETLNILYQNSNFYEILSFTKSNCELDDK